MAAAKSPKFKAGQRFKLLAALKRTMKAGTVVRLVEPMLVTGEKYWGVEVEEPLRRVFAIHERTLLKDYKEVK